MADEPTPTPAPDTPAPETPTPEPVVAETPTPEPAPPPDPVAEIKERLARLEGENQALRTQVAVATTAPRAPAPAQWTPELARQEYDAGRITDDQRVAILASLQARAELTQYDQTRRTQDSQTRATTELQAYMRAYPALNDPTSPLIRQVAAELAQMHQDDGADPRDIRAQLRATKSVLGALRADPPPSSARRGIPVGAGGTPGGGPPQRRTADPLREIPADVVADWKAMGAKLDDPAKAQWYADRYWAREARRGRSRSA